MQEENGNGDVELKRKGLTVSCGWSDSIHVRAHVRMSGCCECRVRDSFRVKSKPHFLRIILPSR